MARTSRYGARAAANLLDAGARLGDRHHADRGHRGRQRKGCRVSARANSWIRSCSRRRRERIQQFFLQGLGHGAPSAHAQPFAGVAQVEVDRAFAQAEDAGGFPAGLADGRPAQALGLPGRQRQGGGREPAARAGAAGVSAGASAGRSAEPGRDCGMASGAGGRWRVDDADHVRPSSRKAANLRACTYCPLIFDGIVACRPSSSSISRPSC